MTAMGEGEGGAVHGRIDRYGRLCEADPALAMLHARAGGEEGGPLAVPQIAALARLARRLGIVISRGVIAADGAVDLDLWVRAQPDEDGVFLEISGWHARPAYVPSGVPPAEREDDFLRAAADWMWETDETLRFTALSRSAAAAVGKDPLDFMGEQLTRLFRFEENEDGSFPVLTALAEQRRFDDQVARLRGGASGRYRLAAVPLIDGTGRFAGFRGTASTVCPGDEEPAAAPAAGCGLEAAASAFGERLDKALRTPLDHIIANAETMIAQPEGPLRRDYATYVEDIATAGRHLRALVDDLADLQAIERPDFRPAAEPIDLADIARRAAGLLSVRAADGNVHIVRPSETENVPATGEMRRALQIAMNLLTNAIRYSPESGRVTLSVERVGNFAALSVSDEGKGIGTGDQARIFGKFERVDPTEPGGNGLGLYISRRLARAMGGDLNVASAPGQGARFILTLPAR